MHFAVQQKLTQLCKSTILQFLKKWRKKRCWVRTAVDSDVSQKIFVLRNHEVIFFFSVSVGKSTGMNFWQRF